MGNFVIYVNIIAALLLFFAATDQVLGLGILTQPGLIILLFTAGAFLLLAIFLQLMLRR